MNGYAWARECLIAGDLLRLLAGIDLVLDPEYEAPGVRYDLYDNIDAEEFALNANRCPGRRRDAPVGGESRCISRGEFSLNGCKKAAKCRFGLPMTSGIEKLGDHTRVRQFAASAADQAQEGQLWDVLPKFTERRVRGDLEESVDVILRSAHEAVSSVCLTDSFFPARVSELEAGVRSAAPRRVADGQARAGKEPLDITAVQSTRSGTAVAMGFVPPRLGLAGPAGALDRAAAPAGDPAAEPAPAQVACQPKTAPCRAGSSASGAQPSSRAVPKSAVPDAVQRRRRAAS